MYQLGYHPKVLKEFKRIHPFDQKKVVKKLEILARDPFSPQLDIKKLVNTKNFYRLRIGDLRVIYEIFTKKRKIFIWEIGYRGSIY